MTNKNIDFIKSETEIPEDVLQDLEKNRQKILNHEIEQRRTKTSYRKAILLTIFAAAVIMLFLINPQVNSAIKRVLGISEDPGVAAIEENSIENTLNLVSESNGLEITMTKFVTTKRKMAFDYQFKMDEKLKSLLEKNNKTADPWAKTFEFMDIELYVEGSDENIYGGVFGGSTSRIEGDMFYGSYIADFINDTIPENAKLTLRITRLAWQDKEEVATKMSDAMADPAKTFTVENAVEYVGDWAFNIDYKPLTQTATPEITNVNNLSDIQVKSDALQTVVKFKASITEDSRSAVTIYKDGTKIDGVMEMGSQYPDEVNVTFSLSALDKTDSIYKVQLNEIDSFGEPIQEIGYFELKNE
ncbi:hypothetical protein [Candidatus Enterococcus clewellii]|uniref:DUF4179 domain-containing protein n=1 Tax=Candidatus Enterococcus clewellii TaxID=1834193 RepID=A0A242K815_9ENTE|nr:hypothetical protein [Enterococcus sp. 9E7_DIV0242]OTP17314.1 hypothetical protein A5888_001452 [Enterococcus sp. 9E7_DIV0242]